MLSKFFKAEQYSSFLVTFSCLQDTIHFSKKRMLVELPGVCYNDDGAINNSNPMHTGHTPQASTSATVGQALADADNGLPNASRKKWWRRQSTKLVGISVVVVVVVLATLLGHLAQSPFATEQSASGGSIESSGGTKSAEAARVTLQQNQPVCQFQLPALPPTETEQHLIQHSTASALTLPSAVSDALLLHHCGLAGRAPLDPNEVSRDGCAITNCSASFEVMGHGNAQHCAPCRNRDSRPIESGGGDGSNLGIPHTWSDNSTCQIAMCFDELEQSIKRVASSQQHSYNDCNAWKMQRWLPENAAGVGASYDGACQICFQETEGSSQCQGNRNSCSGWDTVLQQSTNLSVKPKLVPITPSWTLGFRDDTDSRSGGCTYQWKLRCKRGDFRVCFRETEGSSQCQGHRHSCSGWSSNENPQWTQPFRDDTDRRAGGCTYQWKLEQDTAAVQLIAGQQIVRRICFRETEGSSQCQGHRSACSEWSQTPDWSPGFRDDTDGRAGGCTYHWRTESKILAGSCPEGMYKAAEICLHCEDCAHGWFRTGCGGNYAGYCEQHSGELGVVECKIHSLHASNIEVAYGGTKRPIRKVLAHLEPEQIQGSYRLLGVEQFNFQEVPFGCLVIKLTSLPGSTSSVSLTCHNSNSGSEWNNNSFFNGHQFWRMWNGTQPSCWNSAEIGSVYRTWQPVCSSATGIVIGTSRAGFQQCTQPEISPSEKIFRVCAHSPNMCASLADQSVEATAITSSNNSTHTPSTHQKSCLKILKMDPSARSGLYQILTNTSKVVKVYCDMKTDNGGYTYFPVKSGITTHHYAADNTCKQYGMDIVVPRTAQHYAAMLSKYGPTYFSVVPGVFGSKSGVSYAGVPLNWAAAGHDWHALDGGSWFLSDTAYSQPDGDYTAGCWLCRTTVAGFIFNDHLCNCAASSYVCSTNDKDDAMDHDHCTERPHIIPRTLSSNATFNLYSQEKRILPTTSQNTNTHPMSLQTRTLHWLPLCIMHSIVQGLLPHMSNQWLHGLCTCSSHCYVHM